MDLEMQRCDLTLSGKTIYEKLKKKAKSVLLRQKEYLESIFFYFLFESLAQLQYDSIVSWSFFPVVSFFFFFPQG